jgi:hypothetical protein
VPIVRTVAVVLAPFGVFTMARLVAFGAGAPLSVYAKPGELPQGLAYASAAAIVCVVPCLVLSPAALRGSIAAPAAWALGAHFVTVAALGGDAMPYARLVVPVLPLAVGLVAAALNADRWLGAIARLTVGTLGVSITWMQFAPTARGVSRDREALVEAARPDLRSCRRIATVDIGWTSLAWEGPIFDLAGVTARSVARLPGGHTSKRVPASLLSEAKVDCFIALMDGGRPARAVEARLLSDPDLATSFQPCASWSVGGTGLSYALYMKLGCPAPSQ